MSKLAQIQFQLSGNLIDGTVILNNKPLKIKRSQMLYIHAKAFSWGHEGAGACQLAMAILMELGLTETQTLAYYQRFKNDVITTLPNSDFDAALLFDPEKYDAKEAELRGQFKENTSYYASRRHFI